ncbi:hypothetical protein F5X99DRAFT_410706 [Biscogniauxia marginata]|nr:hypothetical protein F5X99DRAFT_410706 [Biscogniauxia marginata]
MHTLKTAQTVMTLSATAAAVPSYGSPVPGNLTFYTPSWPGWDEYVTRWSTYEAPTFSLAFVPETTDELLQGMAYLSRNNMSYLAKGGGHGYSTTLAVDQNVVQINMENFRDVTVNSDNTVTVGGGARMLDVVTALYDAGRELTVGSFPCVGATGAMLGGGLGRLQGKYGLMSDALRHVKMALWNGTVVEASQEVNSDLFWGLRGAGHNFGIVIETTYETFPDEGGRHYYADMFFTDDSLEGVLNVYKGIIEDGLDPAAAVIMGYVFDSQSMNPLFTINVVYAHDKDAGRRLASNFASTPANATYPITRLSLNESYIPFAELPLAGSNVAVCERGHNQDIYPVTAREFFDVDAMVDLYESYGSFVRANPGASGSILLFESASPQGLLAYPDDHSAFPLRGRYVLSGLISMLWDDNSLTNAVDSWASGARDTLARPEISGNDRLYAYQNYGHGDEPLSALYGYDQWRHERLTGLKQKYDPHNFFSAYHAIPLEIGGWD